MAPRAVGILTLTLLLALASTAGADFLVYHLGTKGQRRMPRAFGARSAPQGMPSPEMNGPGGNQSGREVVLYGTVKKDRAGITYTHPEIDEQLIFQQNQVEIKQAPTIKMMFNKMMGRAGKDPEAVLHAAVWALKKGLTNEFHAAISKVLTLDPQNETALRIHELKKQIETPLPEEGDAQVARPLRKILGQSAMQIETSKHFLLLHDTDSKVEKGRRLSRAKQRLRLLEQMYETFVLLFEAQNVPLELPQDRLPAVLFRNEGDFQEFAERLGVELDGLPGFYNPVYNLCAFYDDSTTPDAHDLHQERDRLDKVAADAKKSGLSLERQRDSETLRQIKINSVLIEIDRWNSDTAAVTREAPLQLAANTGLLPRRVEIPRWVQQGLAMYFESPADEAWAGIGAVDEDRLDDYRAMRDDRVHATIDYIVEDRLLQSKEVRRANSVKMAQVWALTHFLFETHVQELMAYFRLLGTMPPDVPLNHDLLRDMFSSAFGADHNALHQEWRSYMRTLKTDVDRMEGVGD